MSNSTTMYRRFFISFFILFCLLFTNGFSQNWLNGVDQSGDFNFKDVSKSFNEYWKDKKPFKGSGFKQYKRLEWMLEPRLYNTNKLPNFVEKQNEWKSFLNNYKPSDKMLGSGDWKPLGPTTKPAPAPNIADVGIGRVNCVTVDPKNSNILWAGSSTGGIWKSTDGGNNWITFPFTNFMSIGISDIVISSTDPNIVYASTGDADAAGYLGVNFSYSIGVIKTTDGGNTWSNTKMIFEESQTALINRLIIHPQIPNILYAATNKGVFKTTDGGGSWNQITADYCRDLKFKTNNPSVLFGVFPSSNGGFAIKQYTDGGTGFEQKLDLPGTGRVVLATSKSLATHIYAVACGSYPNYEFNSVWRSVDGGNTWVKMADKSTSPNYLSFWANGVGTQSQGLYDLCFAVSPTNADVVYLGGVNVWKSTNGGKSFSCITDGYGGYGLPWIHPDIHALEITTAGTIYACTDGGINKSTNAGTNWSDISNGLQITQFYRIGMSVSNENLVVGGSQDNGTHKYNGTTWKNILGGDGMQCIIDYTNNNTIYGTLYYGEVNKSVDGGNNFTEILTPDITKEEGSWVTPVILHPTSPNTIYVGMYNVWRSTDGGASFSKISSFTGTNKIYCMAISPSNPQIMYISVYGKLYRTFTGGGTWQSIGDFKEYITGIAINPTNPDQMWVTLSGFSPTDKVLYWDGTKWENISTGLPNIPVNCITYQKNSQNRIYIGTDVGVFTRDDGTKKWDLFNTGMPNVIVNDLQIHYGSGKLRAATYGRGLWETKVVDCNLAAPTITITGKTALCNGDSVKLECAGDYPSYKWSNGKTTKSILVKASGDYNVTVADDKQCTATSELIHITLTTPPDFTLRLVGKNPFCEGDFVDLAVNSFAYKSYLWSNGDTNKKITVTKPGFYSVVCYTIEGCSKTLATPYELKMNPKPAAPTVQVDKTDINYLVSTDAPTYQWYLNDAVIAGETQKRLRVKVPGKYYVEITDANGCKSISNFVDISTDVTETANSLLINIQPNPVSDKLNIINNFESGSNVELIITDLIGRNLFKNNYQMNNQPIEIDISELKSGMFFVNLKYKNMIYAYKFIKQ